MTNYLVKSDKFHPQLKLQASNSSISKLKVKLKTYQPTLCWTIKLIFIVFASSTFFLQSVSSNKCLNQECGLHAKCELDLNEDPVCVCDEGFLVPAKGALECVLAPQPTQTTPTTTTTENPQSNQEQQQVNKDFTTDKQQEQQQPQRQEIERTKEQHVVSHQQPPASFNTKQIVEQQENNNQLRAIKLPYAQQIEQQQQLQQQANVEAPRREQQQQNEQQQQQQLHQQLQQYHKLMLQAQRARNKATFSSLVPAEQIQQIHQHQHQHQHQQQQQQQRLMQNVLAQKRIEQQQQQQQSNWRQNKRSLLASLSNRLSNWVDLSRDNQNGAQTTFHQQQQQAGANSQRRQHQQQQQQVDYPALVEQLDRRMRTANLGHQLHVNSEQPTRQQLHTAAASDRYYSRASAGDDWPASYYAGDHAHLHHHHERPTVSNRNYHYLSSLHDQMHPFGGIIQQPTVAPAPSSLERFYGYSASPSSPAQLSPYHTAYRTSGPQSAAARHLQQLRRRQHQHLHHHHRRPAASGMRHRYQDPGGYAMQATAGKKMIATQSEPAPANFIPVVAVSVTKTSPAPKPAPPPLYMDDSQQQQQQQQSDSQSAAEIDEYLNLRLGGANKHHRDRDSMVGNYQSRDSAPRQTISEHQSRNLFNMPGAAMSSGAQSQPAGDAHTTTVKSAVFGYLASDGGSNPLLGALGILGPQFGTPTLSGAQSSVQSPLSRAHHSPGSYTPSSAHIHHPLGSSISESYARPHEDQMGGGSGSNELEDRYQNHPLIDSHPSSGSSMSPSGAGPTRLHHHHHHHLDSNYVAPPPPVEEPPSLGLQLQANSFVQNDIAHPFFDENSGVSSSNGGLRSMSSGPPAHGVDPHSAGAAQVTPIDVYPANHFHSIQLLKPEHQAAGAAIAQTLLNPLLAADSSYKSQHFITSASSPADSGAHHQLVPILFHPAAASAHQPQHIPMRAAGGMDNNGQESAVSSNHHVAASSTELDHHHTSGSTSSGSQSVNSNNNKGKKRSSDFFANAGQILLSALPLLLAPTLGLMFASSPANPAARFHGSAFSQASGAGSGLGGAGLSNGAGGGSIQHSMPTTYINSISEGVVSKASTAPQLFTPTPPGYLLTTTTISNKPANKSATANSSSVGGKSTATTPWPGTSGRARGSSSTTMSPKVTVTLTTLSPPPFNTTSDTNSSGGGVGGSSNTGDLSNSGVGVLNLTNSKGYEHHVSTAPNGQHTIVLVTQEADPENQSHRTHYDVGGYEGVDFDAQYASLRRPASSQSTSSSISGKQSSGANNNTTTTTNSSSSSNNILQYNSDQSLRPKATPTPNPVKLSDKNRYQYAAVTAGTALQVNGASGSAAGQDLDSPPPPPISIVALGDNLQPADETDRNSALTKLYPVSTWPPMRRRTVSLVTSNGNKTLIDASDKYGDFHAGGRVTTVNNASLTPAQNNRLGVSQPASILKVTSAQAPQPTKFDDEEDDDESYSDAAIDSSSRANGTAFGSDKSRRKLTRKNPQASGKSALSRIDVEPEKRSLSRRRRSTSMSEYEQQQQFKAPLVAAVHHRKPKNGTRKKNRVRIKKSRGARLNSSSTSNQHGSQQQQQQLAQIITGQNISTLAGATLEPSASSGINSVNVGGSASSDTDGGEQRKFDSHDEQMKGDASKSKSAHIITTMITHVSDEEPESGGNRSTTPLEPFDYYHHDNNSTSNRTHYNNNNNNNKLGSASELREQIMRKKLLLEKITAGAHAHSLNQNRLYPGQQVSSIGDDELLGYEKVAQQQHSSGVQMESADADNLFSSGGRGRFPSATSPIEVTSTKIRLFSNGTAATATTSGASNGADADNNDSDGNSKRNNTGLVLTDDTKKALANFGSLLIKDSLRIPPSSEHHSTSDNNGIKSRRASGNNRHHHQQSDNQPDVLNSVEPAATERSTYTSNRYPLPPPPQKTNFLAAELDSIEAGATMRPLEPSEWLRNRAEQAAYGNSFSPLRGSRTDNAYTANNNNNNLPLSSGSAQHENYNPTRHLGAEFDNPMNALTHHQLLHPHQQQQQPPAHLHHSHAYNNNGNSFGNRYPPQHTFMSDQNSASVDQLSGSNNHESAAYRPTRPTNSYFVPDRVSLIESELSGGRAGAGYALGPDERSPLDSSPNDQYHYAQSMHDKYYNSMRNGAGSSQQQQQNLDAGGGSGGGSSQFKFNPTSSLNGYNLYTSDHINSNINRQNDNNLNATNYPQQQQQDRYQAPPVGPYSSGAANNQSDGSSRLLSQTNDANANDYPLLNTNGHYVGPPLASGNSNQRRESGPSPSALYDLMRNTNYNVAAGSQQSIGGGVAGPALVDYSSGSYPPPSSVSNGGGSFYSSPGTRDKSGSLPPAHSNAYNNNHQGPHQSTSSSSSSAPYNNQLGDDSYANNYATAAANNKLDHHQYSAAAAAANTDPYSRPNSGGQKYGYASATTPHMNARFSPHSLTSPSAADSLAPDYIPSPMRGPIVDPFYPPTKYSTMQRSNRQQPSNSGQHHQMQPHLPPPTLPPPMPPPQATQLYQPEPSLYSPSSDHHAPSRHQVGVMSSPASDSPVMNEYLKRVQFSDSDRDKLMASYLTCDGLLNDNDHCLERLSCEFSDPQNIEKANKLDRAVSSILLGHILINTYIPNQFKLRLKSASLFGYTQSGKCSRFICNKLTKHHSASNS